MGNFYPFLSNADHIARSSLKWVYESLNVKLLFYNNICSFCILYKFISFSWLAAINFVFNHHVILSILC